MAVAAEGSGANIDPGSDASRGLRDRRSVVTVAVIDGSGLGGGRRRHCDGRLMDGR